jgi:hypothetical protein
MTVQRREATLSMPAKRSLLIGTFVFEQTAPALATRGHPRLTKAGNETQEGRASAVSIDFNVTVHYVGRGNVLTSIALPAGSRGRLY